MFKNCIAQEIVEKILDAHERKRPFKVIIMIPLMPAFEAFVYASSLIIQTTLKTIGKGHFSIYECSRIVELKTHFSTFRLFPFEHTQI